MKTHYGIMPVQAGRIATVKLTHVGFTLKQTFLLTLTGGEIYRYTGKRPEPGEWLIVRKSGLHDVISDEEFQRKLFSEDPTDVIQTLGTQVKNWEDSATQAYKERDELAKEFGIKKKMLEEVSDETRKAWNERDQAREELENCRHDLKKACDRVAEQMTANKFLAERAKELEMKLRVFVRLRKTVVLDNGSEISLASVKPTEPDALDKLEAVLSEEKTLEAMMAEARQRAGEALDKAERRGRMMIWDPKNPGPAIALASSGPISKARQCIPRQPMIGDSVVLLQGGSVFVAIITRTFASEDGSAEMLVAYTNRFAGTTAWQSGQIVSNFTLAPETAPGPRWCYPHELEAVHKIQNERNTGKHPSDSRTAQPSSSTVEPSGLSQHPSGDERGRPLSQTGPGADAAGTADADAATSASAGNAEAAGEGDGSRPHLPACGMPRSAAATGSDANPPH